MQLWPGLQQGTCGDCLPTPIHPSPSPVHLHLAPHPCPRPLPSTGGLSLDKFIDMVGVQDAVHEQQRNAAQISLNLSGGSGSDTGGGGRSAPDKFGPRSLPPAGASSLPTLERKSASLDDTAETAGNGRCPCSLLSAWRPYCRF